MSYLFLFHLLYSIQLQLGLILYEVQLETNEKLEKIFSNLFFTILKAGLTPPQKHYQKWIQKKSLHFLSFPSICDFDLKNFVGKKYLVK